MTDAHLTIFGGEPMDGPRHIWWNFVSSRKDRIEQAKAEWAAGHFQKVPGDEIEFIPLPEKVSLAQLSMLMLKSREKGNEMYEISRRRLMAGASASGTGLPV